MFIIIMSDNNVTEVREYNDETIILTPEVKNFDFGNLKQIILKQNVEGEPNFTRREREVCKLMIDGLTNVEIGEKLFIAYKTVKNHSHSIYKKIKVKNRIELLRYFMKR